MQQPISRDSLARLTTGAWQLARLARRWARTRRTRGTRGSGAAARYFLFVGEDGSCLGGMEDYYGGYETLDAAIAAAPREVHWAEVATVGAEGGLEVVASGKRLHATWRWRELTDGRTEGASGAVGQ